MSNSGLIPVTLSGVADHGSMLKVFEFRSGNAGSLPDFSAGAHIDIHLPNGLIRSYSLCNPLSGGTHYRVCVQRENEGRGASAFMHDRLKAGDSLWISPPRNNFRLSDHAGHSIFIAGGIGITALWGMIQVLESRNEDWQLFYSCKTPDKAAFLDELRRFGDRTYSDFPRERNRALYLNFTDETRRRMDIQSIIRNAPEHAHFYCCGPQAMLEEFICATSSIPSEFIHLERFSAGSEIERQDNEFEVVLHKSGRTLRVTPGMSILDTLLEAGIQAPYQCKEGICGTCEMRVISGTPDHKDSILTDEEKEAGDTIMICCSGSLSGTLVLDC